MFRGKESLNNQISSILVFWAPCSSGEGQVGGGVWVHRGVSPHICTCMYTHAHACMHMYKCIEIANGCQHGGIHVYHV